MQEGSIRSIGRGLMVLQAINRGGSLSMTDIASQCGLPYPTACRIVDTLLAEQMIEREPGRKRYRPTVLVKTLSAGYQPNEDLGLLCRKHIVQLTREVRWPISVCTRVGMSMMIRDCTHAIAPFTLNVYHPGYTMPLLGSSSGKVQLAFSDADERGIVFDQLRRTAGEEGARIVPRLQIELDDIRSRGYSTYVRIRHTANPGKTSAISVPIQAGGTCEGTVTLAFFSSSMTLAAAIDCFLPSIKSTTAAITDDLLRHRTRN